MLRHVAASCALFVFLTRPRCEWASGPCCCTVEDVCIFFVGLLWGMHWEDVCQYFVGLLWGIHREVYVSALFLCVLPRTSAYPETFFGNFPVYLLQM